VSLASKILEADVEWKAQNDQAQPRGN